MKSRMPEIVEPKQLIQSRVLVKRARLTVKRGAARPNGKSKPPQSPLRRAVRYSRRSQTFDTRLRSVVNVKAKNGSIQINARRARDILLVLLEIMFLGFPLLFDILHVFSSVASLPTRVLTLLCEEKMPPNILSGESSGGKHFKLVLEVTTSEACRVVSVGQNWRLDCNKSLHSAAELVPGRSIDTVSFCCWAPCHAEAALCEYTSCNIPWSRMGNFFVMSSSFMAS